MSGRTVNGWQGGRSLDALMAAGGAGIWVFAQEAPTPVFKSKVDLVVLSFTVTDNKGNT